MYSFIKKLFFKDATIKSVEIARISDNNIAQKVFLKKGKYSIDISKKHGIVCQEPFYIAVWLPIEKANKFDMKQVTLQLSTGIEINATIKASIFERVAIKNSVLFLFKIKKVKNYQLSSVHRFVLFSYLLRNSTSTYRDRKIVSALYSYPRKIIIVSYKDDQYCNIFPIETHGDMQDENMYLIGLNATDITLTKMLETKKVVVCDTDSVPVETINMLGKHSSAAPPKIGAFPFTTTESELFKFPVPDFTGSYKEIDIIFNKKMGSHMLLLGKVVNSKVIKQSTSPLHQVGFLENFKGGYTNIDGEKTKERLF